MLPSAVPKYNILFPSYCQFWYSTSICELFCVFHQVSCKWYSCLAKFWHLYMRTAAEWEMETNDNLQLQCLYCLKKILVKIIKICKFLSDSNKEAKCAQLWIFQYSANYLLTYLFTYMGDGSIISAIAVPLALSRCPFAFFGLATGLFNSIWKAKRCSWLGVLWFLRFMDRPAGRVGSGRVGSKNCAKLARRVGLHCFSGRVAKFGPACNNDLERCQRFDRHVLYTQLRRTVANWWHLSLVSGVLCCSRETTTKCLWQETLRRRQQLYAVVNL